MLGGHQATIVTYYAGSGTILNNNRIFCMLSGCHGDDLEPNYQG